MSVYNLFRSFAASCLFAFGAIGSAHADIDAEPFMYHTYILHPGAGVHFTVPSDWNSSYNFVYAIGCSGQGSSGVVGQHTGAPGGGAPFVLRRNVALQPGTTLSSGNDFSVCHGDQTPTWLKSNASNSVVIQADYGRDASGAAAGQGGSCTASIGDLCHNGGTTDVSNCNMTATTSGSPGAPGDGGLLADGHGGGCQKSTPSNSPGGGGGGLGSPYGTTGGAATSRNGGTGGVGGTGMDGLPGPAGGTGAGGPGTAIDGQGGAGPFPTAGSQNATAGSCMTLWVADNNDTAGVCGGASGAAESSSVSAGACAAPSGAGAVSASYGSSGCLGHDGTIVLVNIAHPVAIGDATFGGYPANTGAPEVVSSDLVQGWPDSSAVTNCWTVSAGGNSLTLGFSMYGGGYINYLSIAGSGCSVETLSLVPYGYGRGFQESLRDNAYTGNANPTQAGAELNCGVAIPQPFITVTPTDVDIAEFEEAFFFTPSYRWNSHQDICENNQSLIGNINPPFPDESQEIRSGWHHGQHWADVSAQFGGTIPVVRTTYYDIYVDDTPTSQFSNPEDYFTDNHMGNCNGHKCVYNPGNLVANLEGPQQNAAPPDYSVAGTEASIRLDANVFKYMMYTVNGTWEIIPITPNDQSLDQVQYMNCGQDPYPPNTSITYVNGNAVANDDPADYWACPLGGPTSPFYPDGGLIILATTSDPATATGIAQWDPEAETAPSCSLNCGQTITIDSSGNSSAVDNRVQCFRFETWNRGAPDEDPLIPFIQKLNAGCWLSGVIAPSHLDPNYQIRQGMEHQRYYALGTPTQIRLALLGSHRGRRFYRPHHHVVSRP